MTALNVFVQPQAVHVLTDGAGYAADGTIAWIGRKPVVSQELKAVIAWSGLGSPPQIAAMLQAAALTSQAALLQQLPRMARELHDAGRREAPGDTDGLQLLLAFYDTARHRARALILTTERTGFAASLTPYKLHELAHLTVPQIDVDRAVGRSMNPRTHLGFTADVDGLAILEAQRGMAWDLDGEPVYYVGGFADRYTVTATGVDRAELIRWPDEVGRRIQPEQRTGTS